MFAQRECLFLGMIASIALSILKKQTIHTIIRVPTLLARSFAVNFDNIAQLTQPTEQDISREVLIEKYAKGDETTVEQVRQRHARPLADDAPAFHAIVAGDLGARWWRAKRDPRLLQHAGLVRLVDAAISRRRNSATGPAWLAENCRSAQR